MPVFKRACPTKLMDMAIKKHNRKPCWQWQHEIAEEMGHLSFKKTAMI